jgi:hypothetical protein
VTVFVTGRSKLRINLPVDDGDGNRIASPPAANSGLPDAESSRLHFIYHAIISRFSAVVAADGQFS